MIYEVIVTTVNLSGYVHIAPMGIRHDDNRVLIAPFKPSQTLKNLQTTGVAVVNVTDDVRVYAGCLTGRYNWPTQATKTVNGSRLKGALWYQELEVDEIVDDDLRPKVYLSEVSREIIRPFLGYNRSQAAIIEAAILVSRLHMLPAEKIDSEMEYLEIAIAKTASDREREAWSWLVETISDYRSNSTDSDSN